MSRTVVLAAAISLALATMVTCAGFSAVCGSSFATAATMADLTAAASTAATFANDTLKQKSRIDEKTTVETGFLASEIGGPLTEVDPRIVEAGLARDWAWVAHGKDNSTFQSGFDEATEACVQPFADEIPDDGYMETFMNWALLLRSEEDMWRIMRATTEGLDVECSLRFGQNKNIVYGIIRKLS